MVESKNVRLVKTVNRRLVNESAKPPRPRMAKIVRKALPRTDQGK